MLNPSILVSLCAKSSATPSSRVIAVRSLTSTPARLFANHDLAGCCDDLVGILADLKVNVLAQVALVKGRKCQQCDRIMLAVSSCLANPPSRFRRQRPH